MDFGKAFTFMFEDPDWVRKLGIGTAVMFIGIVLSPLLIGLIPLIMIMGYTVDVVRNVMMRRERPLPEWEDWGGFLGRGFKVFVALFVWALPIIILIAPLAIVGALAEQNGGGMEAIAVIVMICGVCLTFIWGIFYALITPAIYARIAATDRLSAAFEVGKIWAFTRDNLGNVIITILLGIVASLIASLGATLGLVGLCVAVLVTLPLASLWQMLVNAHLYGQIAAESVTAVD